MKIERLRVFSWLCKCFQAWEVDAGHNSLGKLWNKNVVPGVIFEILILYLYQHWGLCCGMTQTNSLMYKLGSFLQTSVIFNDLKLVRVICSCLQLDYDRSKFQAKSCHILICNSKQSPKYDLWDPLTIVKEKIIHDTYQSSKAALFRTIEIGIWANAMRFCYRRKKLGSTPKCSKEKWKFIARSSMSVCTVLGRRICISGWKIIKRKHQG